MAKEELRPYQRAAALSNIIMAMETSRQRWFLCFGTLLNLVRDKTFRLEDDDIDIGIIGDQDRVAEAMAGYVLVERISDPSGAILNEHYTDGRHGTSIDLFYWKKVGGYYYHTYNVDQVKHNGFLPRYTFKGIPAACFDPTEEELARIPEKMRIMERALRKDLGWNKLVPGFESDDMVAALPHNYGACLDWWYPDWATRRPQFGVSRAAKTQTVKCLRDLK